MKTRRSWLVFIWICLVLPGLAGCDAFLAQFRSQSERFRLEGDRLLTEDRKAEAILSYRAALENDPANLAAAKSLADLYAGQNRRRLAQQVLEAAIARAPQESGLSQALAALGAPLPASGPLKLRWQARPGQAEPVGFTLENQRLYVSLADGSVICLEAGSGQVCWQKMLPARATSAPAVGAGRLWLGAQNGILYGLSLENGETVWKFATKAPVYVPPALSGDTVYLASGDSSLYAVNLSDASLKWSFATRGPLHARPTLADGVLYFGSNDAHLYALEASSGVPFWKDGVLTQGAVESQAVVDAGRVYIGSGDSRLYCLATASGGEYWRISTPDAVYAPVVVAGDTLYAASAGNSLYAIQKITGKKQWEVRARSAITAPPVSFGSALVYVAASDPHLYAVNPTSGAPLYQVDTGDWLAAGPQQLNGLLYLLGKDGTILALSE